MKPSKKKKKEKGKTIKTVFNIHFAAGLRGADIDGGVSGRIH